jgi:TetR/AcrR family transcriptional repressor of nem operon
MRASREVMARRHDEIIAQTAKLLRQRGIVGTSLADLMSAAGLTHGGFYKHFESKEELVAEATTRIFDEIIERFVRRTGENGPKAALKAYVTEYLLLTHIKNPERGCPIPAFGPDVGRQDGLIKEAFTAGMKKTLEHVANGLVGSSAERNERAIELIAILSGAVAMARATADPKLSAAIIESARKRANRLIEAKH